MRFRGNSARARAAITARARACCGEIVLKTNFFGTGLTRTPDKLPYDDKDLVDEQKITMIDPATTTTEKKSKKSA